MTQFIRLLSAALCLALVLMGCAREPAEESSDLEPVSYVALPGIDLSALLTTEQVAAGLDVLPEELDVPLLYDDGAAVRYADKSFTVSMDISLQMLSKDVANYAKELCADFEAAPNLGDEAYFDRENGMLYVFFGEYLMNVYVDKAEISDSSRLIVSRHFAALMMGALNGV
ncbi:MAG: hypothetical protein J6K98_06635 [Clostridia bacterium]|nr:hypothetical protein [Clostridia bacterium]